MRNIAEILCDARHDVNMTMRDVAAVLDVSAQTIHYTEDVNFPRCSDDLLERLCRIYKLSYSEMKEQYKKDHGDAIAKRKKERHENRKAIRELKNAVDNK